MSSEYLSYIAFEFLVNIGKKAAMQESCSVRSPLANCYLLTLQETDWKDDVALGAPVYTRYTFLHRCVNFIYLLTVIMSSSSVVADVFWLCQE